MCRVLVRQAVRPQSAAADELANPFSLQLGDLQSDIAQIKPEEANFDFGNLLGDYGNPLSMTDDDLDLLALFGNPSGSVGSSSGESSSTLVAGSQQQPAAPAMVAVPAPVQEQQQAFAAPVLVAPAAPNGPYPSYAPEYAFQQALLSASAARAQADAKLRGTVQAPPASAPQQLPMVPLAAPAADRTVAPASAHLPSRRGKTAAEVAAQIERTKKRRRESAQRSRTRRNCYMKSLEEENHALRDEVSELRARLGLAPLAMAEHPAADAASYAADDATCSDNDA